MQSSPQQVYKKNRLSVPFYTPPPRLYGQTPADIIKEARASVMPMSAVGIRPVFTNRPFTPKEKERTLFGSIREKGKRPASSFSLKSLHCQDVTGHVKLPSITSECKRKTHSIFHYSNNLSLDNLTEDHYAEALEEIPEINNEKFPLWKKSHSCPKEGRMVKAASYNELNQKIFRARDSDWDNLLTDKTDILDSLSLNITRNELLDNPDERRISPVFVDNIMDKPKKAFTDVYHCKGGGDWNSLEIFERNPLAEKYKKEEPKKDESTFNVALKEFEQNIDIQSTLCNEEKKFKQLKDTKKQKTSQNLIKMEKGRAQEEEYKGSRINFTEKSVSTDFKSEYLLSQKNHSQKPLTERKENTVPKEILELYETAKYYGVEINKTDAKEKEFSEITTEHVNKTITANLYETDSTHNSDCENNITENKLNNLPYHDQSVAQSCPKKSNVIENGKFEMNKGKKYNLFNDKEKKDDEASDMRKLKQQNDTKTPEQNVSESWNFFWESSYYKAKEDENGVEDSKKILKIGNSELLHSLISKMTDASKCGATNSTIHTFITQIYSLLKNCQFTLDDTLKAKVLNAIMLFADNEDPEILINLAKLLFYFKFESSLLTAFKMIFKVARFDANDHLFLNEEDVLELFMEGLGRASPLDSAESCVYGYGALKFLTMNYNILSRTLHLGALDLMILHLKMINTASTENGDVGEATKHALFQLTGALRHVAAGGGALPLFITTNCISVICKNLELFRKDEDIVINISRTLSLISTDANITQVLTSVENILNTIIDLMVIYKKNDKILIRLSFCLGNIVEHSDLARIQLLRNDSSLSVLLDILKFYIDKDSEILLGNALDDLNSEVVDDIIVKIIRIIANMSMNPIVGSNLSPVANKKTSLQLSHLLSLLLLRKDPGITLLATLGCLNNVSYYCNSHSILIDLTQGVERVLGLPSEDCQAEAARVLGNLTRHKEVRDLIFSTGGINQFLKLVGSKDQEVVKCTCGALVNMLLDSVTRQEFLTVGGIDKLVKAIERFSGDWSLASLAGRAIWNSCADDLSSAVLHNNIEHLLNILANSLEEENWKDGDVAWEEFASIATDLLEKINAHLDAN